MDTVTLATFLVIALVTFVAGYLLGARKSGSGTSPLQDRLSQQLAQSESARVHMQAQFDEAKIQIRSYADTVSGLQKIQGANDRLEREYSELKAKNADLELSINEISSREAIIRGEKVTLERMTSSFGEEMLKVQEKIKLEFHSAANKIFDDKAQKHEQQSASQINLLLTPLQGKLSEFQRDLSDKFSKQMSDTNVLSAQIDKLRAAEVALSGEARNLTLALKGNAKAQGNWGELVLESVLESSGLENGKQFVREGAGLNLVTQIDDATIRQKPDVIVKLPDNKCIIIDAKVSIRAYERFISADSEEAKSQARKDYVLALKTHVDGLSAKKYHQLDGLNSPEFVIMFLSTEGAFSFALESDPDLFQQAWDQKISIVSPTTLLATLRTVASVWRVVHQEHYAAKIAEIGGTLYDQFVQFADELLKVGKAIESSSTAYSKAYKRLTSGRKENNIIKQAALLKELGAKTDSSIPDVLLDEAESGEEPEVLPKMA